MIESIVHSFQRILSKFRFGDSFRQWIGLFYTEVESAVIINSRTSSFFSRRVGSAKASRSALLYVLWIESLAYMITASPNIVGVALPERTQVLGVPAMQMTHPLPSPRTLPWRKVRKPSRFMPCARRHMVPNLIVANRRACGWALGLSLLLYVHYKKNTVIHDGVSQIKI